MNLVIEPLNRRLPLLLSNSFTIPLGVWLIVDFVDMIYVLLLCFQLTRARSLFCFIYNDFASIFILGKF